jgi:hypothetical protein
MGRVTLTPHQGTRFGSGLGEMTTAIFSTVIGPRSEKLILPLPD